MILALKIKLLFGAYAEDDWEGTVEINSSATLENLHFAIQDALDFDNDHLYEFYIARTPRSRERIRFDDEGGEIYSKTIESLYPLADKQCLFYLFDYGDSWLFKITKNRKSLETDPHVTYPRLVHETGGKPEQYPDWEEE